MCLTTSPPPALLLLDAERCVRRRYHQRRTSLPSQRAARVSARATRFSAQVADYSFAVRRLRSRGSEMNGLVEAGGSFFSKRMHPLQSFGSLPPESRKAHYRTVSAANTNYRFAGVAPANYRMSRARQTSESQITVCTLRTGA